MKRQPAFDQTPEGEGKAKYEKYISPGHVA